MKAYVNIYVGRGRSFYKLIEDGQDKGFINAADIGFTLFNFNGIRTNNPFVFSKSNLKKIYKIVNSKIEQK